LTANDWGEIGLLQMPSARMEKAGNFRFHASRVAPYTRGSVMFQPFDWLEGGFRYTDIADRDYGRDLTSQSYKDKSIDIKVRLWQESRYLPEVAAGARDIGGTGLFSGEYVVASKRTGSLDWTLGMGWGNIGGRGSLSNPLSSLSDKFSTRPTSSGAGDFNFNYFRGRMSPFGGVQWQTPYSPLILKLEYDGNDYSDEPATNPIKARSPFNVGATYRVNKVLDLSAGLERGSKFMVGLTLRSNLAELNQPKVYDVPPPPANVVAPTTAPDWSQTAQAVSQQTDWGVRAIGQSGDTLHIDVEDGGGVLRKERVERVIAVLNRDAPANVKSFSLDFTAMGMTLDSQRVNRSDWVWRNTTATSPTQRGSRGLPYSYWRGQGGLEGLEAIRARSWAQAQQQQASALSVGLASASTPDAQAAQPAFSNAAGSAPLDSATAASATPGAAPRHTELLWLPTEKDKRFSMAFAPSLWQSFGGPDAFMLYQIGVQGSAQLRLTKKTLISGSVNYRLLDNYDKFKYTAPSSLPRVRTYSREYATTSRLTLSNLQITHFEQLTANQFASVYGGLLESMYAGVGGEWLYRPVASRWAFGVDVNRVRQRDFDQRFSLRDYEVTTGHATLYWDTGWQGLHAQLSAGQYLAGDRGATLDLSKRFDNGVVLGAWATKTNVSSRQFGEGSFDKGIYLTIPFDLILPKSTASTGFLVWQPLLRDGGAKLNRAWALYPLTSARDTRAFQYEPFVREEDDLTPAQTGQDLLWPSR
ncbi:MAG: YjbH domain-containing protein, partial [Comamonas sp.]